MTKKAVYIWQQREWPNFVWNNKIVNPILYAIESKQQHLAGMLLALGINIRQSTILDSMTEDVLRSSEIEGELLNRDSVRSSIARHLGIQTTSFSKSDHYTEGIVQVQVDAMKNCEQTLTKTRLCNWHAALFPTGRSGMYKITVANWRQGEDPMLVVSGAMGKEKIHYEAPPSNIVPQEMKQLLRWINSSKVKNNLLKAAIAHLWFVMVHPFDDGNGRLARIITDMLIARHDGTQRQYYSVSAEILKNRKQYYSLLEKASHTNLDITEWIVWFLECVASAISVSENKLANVLQKTEFWNFHADLSCNERQQKMINRLFDGFEGPLTSSKWAKICKCSPDTALRDINDLLDKGILEKAPTGGRSTHYTLKDSHPKNI
ncbi:MAG: Fic family protein [Bacteroidales bacterium]|nr:Fic family protein [Bacteroidales bacterium]